MSKFYLDLVDNRLKYVKLLLEKQNEQVFDFESNINEIKKSDFCVVSPAYKWKKEIVEKLPDKCNVIGGNYDKSLEEEFLRLNYFNIMKDEDFVLKNANLTAEGFLVDLVSQTKSSIYEQKILILGSGRVAKAVEYLLFRLGVKFDVAMRNLIEYNHSKLISNKSILLDELNDKLREYDTIINTIPATLFYEQDVKCIKKECVIFELSSKKCVIEECLKKVNFVSCSALPSKYMSNSAGKLVFEYITKILKGENKV